MTRASGYTKLIALGFDLFGEHIEVLRMLGVLAATVTLIALFFWTRASAGAVAAWIAALLFCLWPDGIAVSVHHRFYAPHGMFFLLGALSVYLMVEQRDWWEKSTLIALGISAAVMFALALLLQKTTLLGIAGVALWVMLVIGQPWFIRQEPGRRWLAIAGLAVLGLRSFLALLVLSGIGAKPARCLPLDAGLGRRLEEPVLVLPRAAHPLLPHALVGDRHRLPRSPWPTDRGRSVSASAFSCPPSSCSRSAA